MLPSPKGDDTGRYSVLVEKTEFDQVRKTIIRHLPEWLTTVPSDAMPPADYFLGPARVKPLFDDGLSSGQNSWMTQSNASFMSMELPTEQNDDYFRDSVNAQRVFSYADVTNLHQRTTFSDFDENTTKESISEVTGARTEADSNQQKVLERLTEQHRQEADKAAQIIAAQRQEIENLKAQRLEDIENRNQAMHQENKRSNENNEDDNSPSEKRRDVRSTPGKKLYYDEMDLRGSNQYKDAMDAAYTPDQQTHE